MNKIFRFLLFSVLILFAVSCKKEIDEQSMYKRPGWLAGKLYTQILQQPELSKFAECIKLTGYDAIINTSGSYTVFAPNNDAFTLYFQEHPEYQSISDIPKEELLRMVKYHIVQNPWSVLQLKSLDVFGWIDTLDIDNNKPKGYKRETILRDRDPKYGIIKDRYGRITLIDSTRTATYYRRQATDARKFAPIFFKEYFSIYDLKYSDYQFYFGRDFSSSDMFYANGKIVTNDIFAENGFIHVIDRVVKPLQNAFQILTRKSTNTYTIFTDIINTFTTYKFNLEKTNKQPGAAQGLVVDSLFDLTYPKLAFEITNEATKAPKGTLGLPTSVTIRYHHGLVAPTDEAMEAFENEYMKIPSGWNTLLGAPQNIRKIIANSHMSTYPIYPTTYEKGFYNGEEDLVTINPDDIVQKEYGSNCTFIGVKKAIVPRAFKSITGPIYLRQGYAKVMNAIEKSGLLPTLKRPNNNYQFFVVDDDKTSRDSSFIYDDVLKEFVTYVLSGTTSLRYTATTTELRTLFLNQTAVEKPKGLARKEFIKNLAGNHLIFNNITREVSGTAPTTEGYKGSVYAPNFPVQISQNADNGITFNVQNWFNFSESALYPRLQAKYPKFLALLIKAGLATKYVLNFTSETESYTVLAPTDAALDAVVKIDTVTDKYIPTLKKMLLLHFIQGSLVFTDGNTDSQYFETTRVDEKSTSYSTVYTKLYLETSPDHIKVLAKDNSIYLDIEESDLTNFITVRNLNTSTSSTPVYPNIVSTGVIHEINKVLLVNEVLTQ